MNQLRFFISHLVIIEIERVEKIHIHTLIDNSKYTLNPRY